MPLPAVSVIGLSVASLVKSVLVVDVDITAVKKKKINRQNWSDDMRYINNNYIQSWNTSFNLHSVLVSLLHVIPSGTSSY